VTCIQTNHTPVDFSFVVAMTVAWKCGTMCCMEVCRGKSMEVHGRVHGSVQGNVHGSAAQGAAGNVERMGARRNSIQDGWQHH